MNKIVAYSPCVLIVECHSHIRFRRVVLKVEQVDLQSGWIERLGDYNIQRLLELYFIVSVEIPSDTVKAFLKSFVKTKANDERFQIYSSLLQIRCCCARVAVAFFNAISNQHYNISAGSLRKI